jgi:hypothetical protein
MLFASHSLDSVSGKGRRCQAAAKQATVEKHAAAAQLGRRIGSKTGESRTGSKLPCCSRRAMAEAALNDGEGRIQAKDGYLPECINRSRSNE